MDDPMLPGFEDDGEPPEEGTSPTLEEARERLQRLHSQPQSLRLKAQEKVRWMYQRARQGVML